MPNKMLKDTDLHIIVICSNYIFIHQKVRHQKQNPGDGMSIIFTFQQENKRINECTLLF